jgi:nucleoside-diphosphate-sugar epimerase
MIVEGREAGASWFSWSAQRTTPRCVVRTSPVWRQVLGWEPRVSLDEGLRLTIEWAKHTWRHGFSD